MRVGIVQPNYLPWRGYLDLVRQVDLFLLFDDVQYTRRDWRNRNRIKTAQGWNWLTVPVRHPGRDQRILEVEIAYEVDWQREHMAQIDAWYRKAPFYDLYRDELAELLDAGPRTLLELNRSITLWLMRILDIHTPVRLASELDAQGRKTDRLLDLLRKVGATAYLSGPAAKDYIEVDKFRDAGIGLEYKTYDYADYPQQWGPFQPGLSVIDLIMNVGNGAKEFVVSRSPNEEMLGPGGQETVSGKLAGIERTSAPSA